MSNKKHTVASLLVLVEGLTERLESAEARIATLESAPRSGRGLASNQANKHFSIKRIPKSDSWGVLVTESGALKDLTFIEGEQFDTLDEAKARMQELAAKKG